MARVIQTVELPDGTQQDVEVDEAWSSDEIKQRLRAKLGLDSPEAPTEPDDLPAFDEAEKPETEPKVTFGDRFERQQELGARAVVEGALGFPLMIGDAANTALNFIPGVELGMPSQAVREAIPLAQPETAEERIASTIVAAGTGTAAGIKTASKVTTGAVNRFLTEDAAKQLAIGTSAGAGMGVGIENDLGPAGVLMSGLLGGVAGGTAVSQFSRRFGQYADSRIANDAPVTKAEVQSEARKVGVDANDAELRNLQDSLEELRVAQRADEQIAKLKPVASDPVIVARAKRHALKKLGGDDKANLPIETKRELARIQRREIEMAEAKVRAAEEQKVSNTKEMKKVRERVTAAKAQADPELFAGTGAGKPSLMSTWGNDVIGRITNVSPRLGMAVRRVSQRSAARTNDDINQIDKFYESSEYKSLGKGQQRELDRHFLNGNEEGMKAIMDTKPGLSQLYDTNVRKLLAGVQRERIDGGLDGFIEGFHPRAVRNLRALQRSRGKTVAGEVEQAIRDANRIKKQKTGTALDEHEVAAIVNQRIGGRAVKQLRDRRINEITPEQQKHYATSKDSLIDYMHSHHGARAQKEFFKHNLGVDKKLGESMDDASLGKVLAKELNEGRLTGAQLDELVPLLSAQFGASRHAVGAFQRNVKNIFTAGVLANPLSTITQFGDLAPLMQKFGVRQTMQSLFSRKQLDVYDVGVRELSKDARTAHGTAKLVRNGLKAVGFEKLDKVMANAGVNAAYSKWTKLAKKNPKATTARLRKTFGDDAEQLVADLQAGRKTDDVRTFIFSEMGDIRPISREDMPLSFQQRPNGRFLFSLLSWTMKQANFVRNSAMRDIKAGKNTKAVKDLITFMALMSLTNGSAQSMKDFVRGKEVDLETNFAQGALALGMSGKYAFDALSRNKGEAALGSIIPFIGILFGGVQSGFNAIADGEPAEIVNAVPSLRNFQSFLQGPIPEIVVGAGAAGVGALVGDAEAGTRQFAPEDIRRLGTREQAQVEAELARPADLQSGPLPVGTVELGDPGLSADQREQQALTNAEIAREQGGEAAIDEHLELREGNVAESYLDSVGKLTGGIGHLLSKAEQAKYPEGTPIPQEVRDEWFAKDSAKAKRAAKLQAQALKEPRLEAALASVNFQLGTQWFKEHKKTWKLMKEGKWQEAAVEAANSKWNEQTPTRVKDLQLALRSL